MKDEAAYKLNREAQAARDLLAEIGNDDEELSHDMIEGETSLLEAVDFAIAEMDDCDITIAGCKEKESQIAERRKRAENRKEKLRGLILQALVTCELPTAKRPTATISVKDVPPAPIITDEAKIPARFWVPQDPKLDKKALNEAAKAEEIPGVTMSNGGKSLQIRRA